MNQEIGGLEIVTNGKDNAAYRQFMMAITGTTGSTRYVPGQSEDCGGLASPEPSSSVAARTLLRVPKARGHTAWISRPVRPC
ncbi:hypothetical protein [Streptomyces sp. XY332]|uniref:hypothetical protein n=1 Tax=Streptomyces sp. XY332 TaxID=1415561 RepID=UPI0006B17675|nr:hypothetical protein [Streptomyces sp. XY332]KOY59210.1 hypothetical protein ADK59_04275 [Streptomyces sp. XY332]